MTTKQNIEKVLWSACDSFRGKIDSSRYKDYILSMLFVKYLSDVYAETKENYMKFIREQKLSLIVKKHLNNYLKNSID